MAPRDPIYLISISNQSKLDLNSEAIREMRPELAEALELLGNI